MRILVCSYSLLIMLLYLLLFDLFLLLFNLIRVFPRVGIRSLEANGTDAVVSERKVVAMFDASGFSIVEMVEFDVVLNVSDLHVDCLAED